VTGRRSATGGAAGASATGSVAGLVMLRTLIGEPWTHSRH